MVRQHNTLDAMLICKNGVFDALDALDDHRQISELPDPGQDLPINGRGDGASHNFGDSLSTSIAIQGLYEYEDRSFPEV